MAAASPLFTERSALATPPDKRSGPMGTETDREEIERAKLGEWGKHAGFGIQYAVTIGIFALVGWKLDGWLGTEPWLIIAMVFLGFIGATVSLVKQLPSSRPPAARKGLPPK